VLSHKLADQGGADCITVKSLSQIRD